MRLSEKTRQQAGGYTMIELLVVITIIILIAGLLLSALGKARETGPRVQTKAEMAELAKSIENFKSTYQVQYVPTALILCSDYNAAAMANPSWTAALADSQQYVKRVWPKLVFGAGGSLPPNTVIGLDGNQVMLFLLGGVGPTDLKFTSGWNGTRSGFLNSPTNPFNISGGVAFSPPTGERAKGPFFDFKVDRIDTNSHYLDVYGTPYYYFSSRHGNDYSSFGIYQPVLNFANDPLGFNIQGGYGGMNPFGGADGKYIHSNSFQIISAGKDLLAGPGGANFNPGVGGYSPGNVGGDDLSNWHGGPLGGGN